MTQESVDDATQPVSWTKRGDGVAIVTIDRPRRLNALNLDVKRRIEEGIEALVEDTDVRAIVITGANGVFVAGTDIAEMVDMSAADHEAQATGRVFEVLRACRKPIIAAVERFALGGGMELALACDLIVAGNDAKFGQPEIKVGIMPGAGGSQVLLRTVGKFRAMKLILTGEPIGAPLAHEWGFVSDLVEPGAALEHATEIAAGIASMPPLSVAAIKDVMRRGQDSNLSESLALEREAFTRLFDSDDQAEGMKAFLEKRPPRYTGR